MSATEPGAIDIFPWTPNFEVGIGAIDEQHRVLVDLINKLAMHLTSRSAPVVLDEVFSELKDYTKFHFGEEETLWRTYFEDDTWFLNHEKGHRGFVDKLKEMKAEGEDEPIDDVVKRILTYLTQWLGYHILESDRRMALVVHSMEAGATLAAAKSHADEVISETVKTMLETILSMYGRLTNQTVDLLRERTLRKQAEDALFLSEERWKFILEQDTESIWEWDDQIGTTYDRGDDAPLFDPLKICRSEPIGESSGIHPVDIGRLRQNIQDHLDNKIEFFNTQYRILRRSGAWSWMNTRGKVVARNSTGQATRMIGTHSDVTERVIGSLIFHHGSQAIIVTDLNHRIVSVNPAFTEMTGYTMDEVRERKVSFLMYANSRELFENAVDQRLKRDERWSGEITLQVRNGQTLAALVVIGSVSILENQRDHYTILLTDITEKKQIDERLRRAQKSDAVGMLAAGITHDFNNILAIMMANLEYLELRLGSSHEVSEQIDDMKAAGDRGSELVKQILDYTRPISSHYLISDINGVIHRLRSMLSRSISPNIVTEVDLHVSLWASMVDRADLEEALLNLSINACDAMPSGGVLSYKTENCSLQAELEGRYRAIPKGDYVKISVSDNGIGMSAKQVDRIFEPYFTTKADGYGLGMPMVHNFVERFKGGIQVDSTLGVGTTVCVYLPRSSEERTEALGTGETDARVHSGRCILMVEDEPGLLSPTMKILTQSGYVVLAAESADQATELLQQGREIDLLFTDVVMPGRMNGYELAVEAQKVMPRLRVLLTTGRPFPFRKAGGDGDDLGRFDVIHKPYLHRDLLDKINSIFDRS